MSETTNHRGTDSGAVARDKQKGVNMIHALHLLWIVPLAASFGFMICAVLAGGSRNERLEEKNE